MITDKVNSTTQLGKVKDPLFLIGLGTLLVNDFYAKYEFANEITGKLSDIAGLFIFPYFFSALLPRFNLLIYLLTGILFTFWKLPVSQPLFNFWNNIGIEFYRTIDYSDLLTLIILPLSFNYFNSKIYKGINQQSITVNLLAFISVFSFCATTLPKKGVNIQADVDQAFVLEFNKEELFNRMNPTFSSDTLSKSLHDSLFYLHFYIPEFRADIRALSSILESQSGRTTIKLDSIVACSVTGALFFGFDQENIDKLEMLKPKDIENYFEKDFVEKLKKNPKNNSLYYSNKEVYDDYMKDR
ncbi:hypothetical protein [Adhaeribacter pallidiroseus]|uniref:Uncharacterized protein n=1 Tax=Adhaeribacter pallidiroseus TaxID=2072847 RepID=A0A369QJX9_9BACT|nr:hypothetical protein [Adhaeribacter pallidiroseus]RDC65221.1 hypothetical protein AHMF7616_03851 [Adhaeribacter pallidiroseus]